MADDKRIKLKEFTQGEMFTRPAAKWINTGLTHYVCLNNHHKVKQLYLYTLEIKTGDYLPNKNMLKVSNKISIKRFCVSVFKINNKKPSKSKHHHSGCFVVNFELSSNLFLMLLYLTFNIFLLSG